VGTVEVTPGVRSVDVDAKVEGSTCRKKGMTTNEYTGQERRSAARRMSDLIRVIETSLLRARLTTGATQAAHQAQADRAREDLFAMQRDYPTMTLAEVNEAAKY
jgi:hypothetical protein